MRSRMVQGLSLAARRCCDRLKVCCICHQKSPSCWHVVPPNLRDGGQLLPAFGEFLPLCLPASPGSLPTHRECLVSVEFLNQPCFVGTSSMDGWYNVHALFSVTTWIVFGGLLAD